MEVKFKKLSDDAVLPSYASVGDTGLDITAVDNGAAIFSEDGKDLWYYVEYKTGLAIELPENHVGLIFPRSSISKSSLLLANSIGVIDQFFRGEICLRFKIDAGVLEEAKINCGKPARYKKGDRIAQLVIVPFPTIKPVFADSLSETTRNTGGFGSSGA